MIAWAMRQQNKMQHTVPKDMDEMIFGHQSTLNKTVAVPLPDLQEAEKAIRKQGAIEQLYGLDEPDRPAYPKIAKEREDAAKAAEQQRLQQQDQHGPDMAGDATGPQESESLRVSAQEGEKET